MVAMPAAPENARASSICRRDARTLRRQYQSRIPRIRARTATPPTAPPAIAAVYGSEECYDVVWGEKVELAAAPADVPVIVVVEVSGSNVCEVRALVVIEIVIDVLVAEAVADDIALGFDMGL